jgi:serine/threonine protein kinase
VVSRTLAEDSWCLPADCVLLPVSRLRPTVRAALNVDDGHFVLTRPNGRARAMVLDADAAAFVDLLREPTTIVGAVRTFAARRDRAAAPLIDELYPLLNRLRSAGLLVRPEAAAPIGFRLQPGEWIGDWQITAGVQTLDECEVYETRHADGRCAAVKLARHGEDRAIRGTLAHEAQVLGRLADLRCVPDVLDQAEADGRPFLALQWREGIDALAAAGKLRDRPEQLLALAVTIAQAYAQLHAAGVVHGDVHPKNVMVDDEGSVSLIDFGLARVIETGPGPHRQGVGYFYEPEFAHALLIGRRPPAASPSGEVYALTAQLYLLMSGQHYLSFPLQRRDFLLAVRDLPALPWSRHRRRPWPQVEAALAAGLAKDPTHRPGAAALADALAAVSTAPTVPPEAAAASAAASDQPVTGDPWSAYLAFERSTRAPMSSLHYGTSGLAWGLQRVAQLDTRPELLAVAEHWARPAPVDLPDTATLGYYNPRIQITPTSVGADSLHHGPFGSAVVRCLVAHTAWDMSGLRGALADLIAGSQQDYSRLDLVSGLSGVLLGLALVAEALPADPHLDTAALTAAGTAVAARLANAAAASSSTRLGLAHGWAGIWYAQLRWAESVGCLPPQSLPAGLDPLISDAEPDPGTGGLLWPAARGESLAANRFQSGWCNGAAGFTLLFLAAERTYPGAGYERVAMAAAESAFGGLGGGPSLCCGTAGRAYALLAVAAHTGQEQWRQRARALAADLAATADSPHAPRDSLYKGALGVHLLQAELAREDPRDAAFPLCEPAGWARRTWIRDEPPARPEPASQQQPAPHEEPAPQEPAASSEQSPVRSRR